MSLTSLGNELIADRLYRSDRIHAALPHPESLTDESMDDFQKQGFIAVENVFTPQEVEIARQSLGFLIGGGNPEYKGIQFEKGVRIEGLSAEQREPYVRKVWRFVKYEPRLEALSRHQGLLSIVRRLIGTEVNLTQDMALLKPPRVGREKPWHQDTAYFDLEPLELILGAWIALDNATPENGCMHVIPASHIEGPRPHYHDRDCQLPDEEVRVERNVVVPLRPGGVLFFSGLLHHGTPPNSSALRRWAIQFHYASVNCRKMDAATRTKYFHDADGYAGCGAGKTGELEIRPIAKKPM